MPQDKKNPPSQEPVFVFGKENYVLLLLSVVLVIVGYILMAGGGSDDPNVFNPEIFSFRRITLAPIIVTAGYLVALLAIIKRPKGDA